MHARIDGDVACVHEGGHVHRWDTMTTEQHANKMEADLKRWRVPVVDLLTLAGVNQATWWRLKNGKSEPLKKTWDELVAAFNHIKAQHPETKDAAA